VGTPTDADFDEVYDPILMAAIADAESDDPT